MRLKRIVALILSFLIVFNVQTPMLAETEENEDGPRLHTVTWSMDPEYSLEELTPKKTTMTDEGQIFTNSEGLVRTEIQAVYHVDQTLVTVSLAGTSFSFAPIMNDNYFLESGIGDADSSGIKDPEKDKEPETEEEKKPEETVVPEQPEATKPVATKVPQEAPDSDETPEEEPTEVPDEDPTEKPTEKPTEEQTVPQNKDDSDNTPVPAEEPDELETLHTGYGKTLAQTNLYDHVNGTEAIGKLPMNAIVYITSLPSQQWVQIVFDTPDGIVDGYVRAKNIVNLEFEEEQRVASEVKTTTDYREWKEHPLPRTEKYTMNVRETEQPKVTEVPELDETEEPETTITPEEGQEDSVDTPAPDPTDTPVPGPTDTSVPDSIDTPVPDPTDTPIPETTDSPVPDSTDTPDPESTDTPIPDPIDTPVPETTDTPVPESIDTSIPDRTDILATDSRDTLIPDPTEKPQDQDESVETNEESDNSIGTGLLRWFFSSALAEEELPEENRIRPSVITGQKVGGNGASKMRMLRSAAPASTGFNAAVYPGLFDIATDVRLSVSTTGVKEDVLVSQYTGNHIYSYKLNTEGLTATLAGKEVILCDKDGNCLARIEAPNMTDASGNYSTDIEVALEASGDSYILTYEPNDEWMQSAVYPVTIDPTGQYYNNLASHIGDVYVTSSQPDKHYKHYERENQSNHNLESTNLYAGTIYGESIAYVMPSLRQLPSNELNSQSFPGEGTELIIKSVIWSVKVDKCSNGSGNFRISLVTGEWETSTVTYNNRPTLSSDIYIDINLHDGWNDIDVTKIFSAWFNALDNTQKPYRGFAITSTDSWAKIFASDIKPNTDRMRFTAEYVTGVTAPANFTATTYGNGVNSRTGGVNLSWTAVQDVPGYSLGIYDGKQYEYHYIGNTTNYTTKGQNLWVTQEEVSQGKYVIHWDGKGQELTVVPRSGESGLNYSFVIIPSNSYGQTAGSITASGPVSVRLPDTMQPDQPVEVKANPAGYTKGTNVIITWSGVKDEPLKPDSMPNGHIQYVVDPDTKKKPETWGWKNTGLNKANGTYNLNVSELKDGTHAVYIRGIDEQKNFGEPRGVNIYIDRTTPTTPTVSFTPKSWTSQATGAVSWKGLSDQLNNFRVEYRIDQGQYNDIQKPNSQAGTLDTINLSSLSEGKHTISIRGVDSAGNVGKDGTATIYIDRNGPTLSKDLIVEPADWTNKNEIKLQWFGAKDTISGLNKIAYAVDNSSFTDIVATENGSKNIRVSDVAEGEHLAKIKLTDGAGHEKVYSAWFKIDRSAPTIGKVSANVASWTANKELQIRWENAVDKYSGLNMIKYAVDKGQQLEATTLTNGYAKVNVSALTDGIHSVTLYVKDKVGYETQKEVPIYIDRTPPVINEWEVTPNIWSHETEGVLTWSGVSDATSGLKTMSYQIDNGALVSLAVSEEGSESLNLSALSDGEHTITFYVTDQAGVTAKDTETLYIDRTPPVIEEAIIDPDVWADTDTLNITWTGAMDACSNLVSIGYSLDEGLSYTDLETKENGEGEISVSEIADGEHEILLRLTDEAQNETIIPLTYQIDRTAPEVEILSPAEDDIVSGVLDIQGSVTDISLTDWVFKAWDDAGEVVELQGNEEKQTEQLGLVDTSVFPDGDEIFMTLTAHDAAGHETISEDVCVKANHQAQKVSADVEIIAPENNEILSDVQTSGQYELKYIEEEAKGIVILDRNMVRNTEDLSFPLYPIIYPENTSHTVSIISTDEDGQVHYSQGYQSTLAFSDLLQSEENIASSDNVQFGETGAVALSDNASFTLNTIFFQRDAMAVRIHCLSNNVSEIACEYSLDRGENWLPLDQNRDTVFPVPQSSIQIRCAIGSAGTVLQGLDLTEIHESNPVRFKSTLLRAVSPFSLIIPATNNTAMLSLEKEDNETLSTSAVYTDGSLQRDSHTVNLLPYEDNTKHTIAQAGINESGTLYGSGAHATIILRSVPDSTDEYESGQIDLAEDTYILRTEALFMDEDGNPVRYEDGFTYSLNGTEWIAMPLSEYCFLPSMTRTLWLRASLPEGVILKGLHVEGVSLKNTSVIPILVKPVNNVVAKDYGQFSGDQKRYVLTWTDPNEQDDTLKNTIFYDVYRNGEQIASVLRTTFTDTEYVQNAAYEVVAQRVYEDPQDGNTNILTRNAKAVRAIVKTIQAPVGVTPTPIHIEDDPTPLPVTPKPTLRPTPEPITITAAPTALPTYGVERVTPAPEETVKLIDFEDPNSIYANMEYGKESELPVLDFALDQSLLGPNRFCSLGFEPINFNTGNFFVEARDFAIPDVGGTGLDLIRTYNSQALTDGSLFGNKWSCEADQTLTMNDNGVLCWRRSDGSLVRFMKKEGGRFITDTTEFEAIAETEDGYLILLTDGTGYGFDKKGNLNQIQKNNGQQTTQLVRNVEGYLDKIILPSGKELRVETNKQKQITKIWLTDTSCVRYVYSDNMLVEVTDAEGNKTRYEYDPEGQMTAWYDGNGVCQARNTYDDQNRVVAQTDANGGEYRLEYGDNYTIATDAEGNSITYIYDEQRRTSKIIDAQGGETLYIYGTQSEIISQIDPLGNVTTYSYNNLGDKISSTDARGYSVFFEWDGAHHLLSKTDQNRNTTRYTYDKKGNLSTETAPDGGVTSYTYDSNGNILSITDALGNITSYSYNKQGLLETAIDPLENKTTYTYDKNGYPASETNVLGETTLTNYDAKGNLLKKTFADNTSVSYTYDALGRQTSMTDPKGNTTRYEYDGLGHLIRTIFPDGSQQKATYTKNGKIASVSDALGNTSFYTYDANGNRLTVTDADGYTTTDVYDLAGHLLNDVNALGGKTVYTYDTAGLPLSVADPAGTIQVYEYDACGNILVRILANGAKITAEYDSMNRMIRQVNAMGGETRISYDLLGRITEVTDPLGARTTYTYDANGNLLTATNALGNSITYTYDALNRVAEEKAPNGAVTKYEYDVTGNLIATIDALGNKTTYEYDGNGNLTTVTDALGQTASILYDKNGQAVSAEQKNGGKLATLYDRAGRIVEEADANGNKTRYAYNGRGLTTEIIDAINQKAEYEYDALGNLVRITAPGGQVTLYEYDTAGRLTKTTDALGCETEYQYDVSGQIAQTIINGNASTYEYDVAGNISAVTDAEGRRVQFEYDVAENNTAVIYPDGSKDTIEYDLLGRVSRQIPRTGLMTEYAYDEFGNITSVKQGDQITKYEYDLLGRLVRTIAADGSDSTYEYDALGNLIATTDALGNSTRFEYTPEALLARVTYANGAKQSLTYDLAGNVLTETDAEGYTKKYGYDKVNRLISVTDELGHKTAYTYNANDQITQVKDALGHITGYTYDANGKLIAETDALGNSVHYQYSPEGWLEKAIKADGTEISFENDKTGNLLKQQIGDTYTVTTGYNELGQVTTLHSEAGDILYQYNEKGYLIAVTNVNGEKVTYDYDEYGNKVKMIYPGGREVDYIYDALNRLTGVKDTDGEETCYEYDAAGRRIRTTTGTLTTAYDYDEVGSLIKQSTEGDSSISFSYSYNKNGYITGEIRTENGDTTETAYQYDAVGQLTSFRKSTGYAEQYVYDAAGNMTKKVISPEKSDVRKTQPVTIGMKYNKGNQLTEMTVGKDRITYSYDLNGSMIQKVLKSQKYGTLTDAYTYDALDQLMGYTGYDGYEQTFTYDAAGMRLSKKEKGDTNRSTLEELLRGSIAGLPEVYEPTEVQEGYEWATTEYLYDITQEYYQVIREKMTTQNHTETTEYVYGLERIAGYSDNNKTNYIYDGRGSVVQMITVPVPGQAAMDVLQEVQTAVAIQSYAYTPFGEQLKTKTSGFTYNAEANDAATGMINLRARQYEPAMNRFAQKDILKGQATSPLSLNRYGYCESSPILFADPSGMQMMALAIADGGAGKKVDNKKTAYSAGSALKGTASKAVNSVVEKVNNTVQSVAAVIKEENKKIVNKVARQFENEAWNATTKQEREIINNTLEKLDGLDLSSNDGIAKTTKLMGEACTQLGERRNARSTPGPTSTPVPTTTPLPTATTTRSEDWDIGFRASEIADQISPRKSPIDVLCEGINNAINTITQPSVNRFRRLIKSSNVLEASSNLVNYFTNGMGDKTYAVLFKGDLTALPSLLVQAFIYGGGPAALAHSAYTTTQDLWLRGDYYGAPVGNVQSGTFDSAFDYTQSGSPLLESVTTDEGTANISSGISADIGSTDSTASQFDPHAIGNLGEEELARIYGGKVHYYRNTPMGKRFIDLYQTEISVGHESKVGYVVASDRIKQQVEKDAWLKSNGIIREITWHFFESPYTGLQGPSKQLEELLDYYKINRTLDTFIK